MAYLFVVWIPSNESDVDWNLEINSNALSSSDTSKSFINKDSSSEDTLENTTSTAVTIIRRDEDGKEISHSISIQEALKRLLESIGIQKYDWQPSGSGGSSQVLFVVQKEDTDYVLEHLYNIGIGTMNNTSVSIILTNHHKSGEGNAIIRQDIKQQVDDQKTRAEFIKSVKARLTVAQVVEAVKMKSILTFDYVLFLIIASIISVIGFIEDNPVILIVSILVAPLMGPLLAILFSLVIKNRALCQLGIKTLGISLLICLSIGFVFGLIGSGINHDDVKWSGDTAWPTSSMKARGIPRALWVGVLVSIPTGAGVALSVLGGTTGPLVGVAVSASLLGPICNAGMLFADAVVSAISPPPIQESTWNVSSVFSSKLNCTPLADNDYDFYYTCTMSIEALILAVVSLCGTILDVLCMFIMGFIILKIKEVTPNTAQSDTFEMFWKKDIKVARKAYTHMEVSSVKPSDLARDIAKEEKARRISVLPSLVIEIEDDSHYRRITDNLSVRPPNLSLLLDDSTEFDDSSIRSLRRVNSNPTGSREVKTFLRSTKYTVPDNLSGTDNLPV